MSDRMEEEILRDVLLEAVAREYGEIMDVEEDIPVSRRYKKEMYTMCEDPMRWARRKRRPLWKKCVRITAMIFLAITILFTLVLTVSPKARAAMTTWVEDLYIKCVEYRFPEDNPKEISNSRPEYEITEIPAGYYRIKGRGTQITCGWQGYLNSRGQLIQFKYSKSHFGYVSWIETNHMTVFDVAIEECRGRVFVSENEKQANIISWIDEKAGLQFFIEGYVRVDELLNMARSVRLVKSTKWATNQT